MSDVYTIDFLVLHRSTLQYTTHPFISIYPTIKVAFQNILSIFLSVFNGKWLQIVQNREVRGSSTFCSAINCSNSKQSHPEVSFFRFPSDRDMEKWLR